MNLPVQANARRRLALLFSIPVLLSIVFFILDVFDQRNESRLSNVQYLQSCVSALRSISNDAEMGENGYLLTDDERYAAILESANLRLRNEKEKLRRIAKPYDREAEVEHIVRMVENRTETANRVLRLAHESGKDAAVTVVRQDASEWLMSGIRDRADQLQGALQKQIDQHNDQHQRMTRWSFLAFLFGTLTMLVVLVRLYTSLLEYMRDRDQAHAEAQKLNEELEERIQERTAELQRFNEELQQFAYVASHDLQEPLRTITSFTQLLATRYHDKLDSDADEFIGYIVSSARRMTDLINGLLALVRLRKTGQAASAVPFETLVSEAVGSLQAAIRDSSAHVEVGALPALMVDRIQFAQVFQNLISNAIKYRREEVAPDIRIRAERDLTHWIILVEDNGRGFDQQFAERIFGLFQRLHGRDVEGTGMGLSIARRIVERHGGRMWAKSEEGVGSTFFFSLPASLETRATETDEPLIAAL